MNVSRVHAGLKRGIENIEKRFSDHCFHASMEGRSDEENHN